MLFHQFTFLQICIFTLLSHPSVEEAMRFVKAERLKEKQREEDEKKLFGDAEGEEESSKTKKVDPEKKEQEGTTTQKEDETTKRANEANAKKSSKEEIEEEITQDTHWNWDDTTQVHFNPVQRINIHDNDASSKVKEARVNGVPIVLIGHVGWADFARRWLSKKGDEKNDNCVDEGKKVEVIDVDGDVKMDAACEDTVNANAQNGENESVVIDVDKANEKIATENGQDAAINGSAASMANGTNGMVPPVESFMNGTIPTGDTTDQKNGIAALPESRQDAAINGSTTPIANGANELAPNRKIPTADTTEQKSDSNESTMESNCIAALPSSENGVSAKSDANEGAVFQSEPEAQTNGAAIIDGDSKPEAASDAKPNGLATTNGESKPDASLATTNGATAIDGDSKPAATLNDVEDSPLDLSRTDYYLDIQKMIKDIGEEDVPVIKRNYNEEKPIHGNIHAAKFLTNCWPSEDADPEASKKAPLLYLHQWQFPLSDTAGRKLCHQNNPLPKSIMGEDLLKYWIDLPQCKFDSPLQYIFMGREDTLSKLHSDPGGLDISIAPIVGEKECVLVHRADGSNCLYHLQANINDIDLHQYPLLTQAKIWRTTIKPGEILLMPQGTYHQCRNVTPCLSYSRFHLDTVNLLPFIQSLVNGDAPEIEHEDILWNLTSELISKVDEAFDHTQSLVKQNLSTDDDISEDTIETVDILRTLRHFVREVARRHEIKQRLKGAEAKPDHCFSTLVDDVDMVS